jgi:nicotinate-nucleotide adenylyltransferase
MVFEAIQGIEGFSLDDREMKSGGISYTIDTIEQYRKGTESELYFIIGADQFHQLYNWHRVDDLIEELKFLVYPRKGYALDEAPILSSKVINYEVLNLPYWDMSSTKIRKLCERSESIEAFVPRNVEAYIKQNQIYQSS